MGYQSLQLSLDQLFPTASQRRGHTSRRTLCPYLLASALATFFGGQAPCFSHLICSPSSLYLGCR
jgi:hypothetical protein